MSGTQDEVAGVVDLFGGLTREELQWALSELAFKQGRDVDADALDSTIESAVREYYLAAVPTSGEGEEGKNGAEELLVAGPAAFPELPENAADLPHIMDVETRSVDREAAAKAVHQRLLAEAERAASDGDETRASTLLDASYDLETWAAVDAEDVRRRLEPVLD